MDDLFISLVWHYAGVFCNGPQTQYVGGDVTYEDNMDPDKMSIIELQQSIRKLGYTTVQGVLFKAENDTVFVNVDTDRVLLDVFKGVKKDDEVHLYVIHNINDPEIVIDVDVSENAPECGSNDSASGPHVPLIEAHVGQTEAVETHNGRADVANNINESFLGGEGGSSDRPNESSIPTVEGQKEEGHKSEDSSDEEQDAHVSDADSVDGSDVDDELRAIRQEKRELRRRKIKVKAKARGRARSEYVEIPIGEVGADPGYENAGDSSNKYAGKVAGDEDFYGSDDPGSCESDLEEGQEGEDVPRRRPNKNVYYNPNCAEVIWELGMVFESAVQFRQAVAKYAVAKGVQLKLRPNESSKVRVKCQKEGCPWELFTSYEGSSHNFIIKTYNPKHKCDRRNKNKLCNHHFIAAYYQKRIISQPGIKIWELVELCKEELKDGV